MKKLAMALIVLVAVTGTYAYYWAPRATLTAIRDAWLERDAVRLGDLVDFAALRSQMKTSILTTWHEETQDSDNLGSGLLGHLVGGLATGVMDVAINKFVTPEWLVVATLPDPAADASRYQERRHELEARLNSYIDSAQFQIKGAAEIHCEIVDSKEKYTLILKREGMRWRVRGFSNSVAEMAAKASVEPS